MLELQSKNGHFYYSIFRNPVARVLKARNVVAYFNDVPQGGRVLDYGSGDRPYEQFLLTRFDEYVAGDHPDTNQKHEARPDVYIENDRIELESDSVDCVMLTEVLEHIYEPRKALEEIHRVLKPGGCVIGSVPFSVPEHEQPYDFFRYTSFALNNLAADAQFDVVKLEYVGDMIGVWASVTGRAGSLFSRILRRCHLSPLARLNGLLVRLPEICYLALLSTPLSPSRVAFFRTFPLGFTFHLKKKTPVED